MRSCQSGCAFVDNYNRDGMTALLQASTGSDRPVLLHYDTKAGHSAGRSITKVIEDLTDEFSFLFWQLDVGSSGQKAARK